MEEHPIEEYTEWTGAVNEQEVATLELTHEKSALTPRGLAELGGLVAYYSDQDDVEAIVIAGGPEAFCVGFDVEGFVDLFDETPDDPSARGRRLRELAGYFHSSILEIRNTSLPVVAAVDGVAAGGGFSLVLATDYVVASTDAVFTHAYTNIGATADGGSTYFLPHLVGLQKAKELVFMPQPLSPDEMADLGLVNEVVEEDFEGAVAEVAAELARRPTEAIARTKRMLNESFDSTLETQLEREREAFAAVAETETFESRVRAFVERRR